jgi:ketosteroid isomerase-like protein
MSQENVEIVRKVVAEFSGSRQISELVAPDVVWDMGGFRGWLGQSEFLGVDGFWEFFGSWIEPYAEWDQQIERVLDGGRDRVVVLLYQHGRLRGSKSWVELHYGAVGTVENGAVQRMQVYASHEDALEAVGLRA